MSFLSRCHLKEVSYIAHCCTYKQQRNSPRTTSSLNDILLYHCIAPLQDSYSEDLTGFPKVTLRTVNLINKQTLSCKIPTKKIGRKNLMHSLPGAGGLQTQEQHRQEETGRQEETSVMAARTNRAQAFWGRPPSPNVGFATNNHLQHVHWPVAEICVQAFNRSTSVRPYALDSYSDRRDHHTSNFTLQKLP